MKKRHINDIKDTLLESHTDDRGIIVDLFYNETIHHVARITSKPWATRGNHYHKKLLNIC